MVVYEMQKLSQDEIVLFLMVGGSNPEAQKRFRPYCGEQKST